MVELGASIGLTLFRAKSTPAVQKGKKGATPNTEQNLEGSLSESFVGDHPNPIQSHPTRNKKMQRKK